MKLQRAQTRVLFLCTANSARSQMAEALLSYHGGDQFFVRSAGTRPATEVRPEALTALAEVGIDWRAHSPKPLPPFIGQPWDFVITLCDQLLEACPVLPAPTLTEHWGIPDPSQAKDATNPLQAFRETIRLLVWRMELCFELETLSAERVERRYSAALHIGDSTSRPTQPTELR